MHKGTVAMNYKKKHIFSLSLRDKSVEYMDDEVGAERRHLCQTFCPPKGIVHFLDRFYAVFVLPSTLTESKKTYIRKLFAAAYKSQRFLHL